VDISSGRYLTSEYKLTPQGRPVPDPDNPGSFLFATGPGGQPILAGVQIRVRAFRIVKGRKVAGQWAYSEAFGLNNNNPPTVTIDSVEANTTSSVTSSDEHVRIHWSVYDPDSEDFDGDQVLDLADGEDLDGDGELDCELVGVAFDYHRVTASEDPATMTTEQLNALQWLPCTRVVGEEIRTRSSPIPARSPPGASAARRLPSGGSGPSCGTPRWTPAR
jgi:hypothetical protein